MSLTEMERIAGFHEPPQKIIIALPLPLGLFNELSEQAIQDGIDVKEKIRRILEGIIAT